LLAHQAPPEMGNWETTSQNVRQTTNCPRAARKYHQIIGGPPAVMPSANTEYTPTTGDK
jgi:hypothetical protein